MRDELGEQAVLGGAVQPLRWMPYLALQRACGVSLSGSRVAVMDAAIAALGSRVLLLDDLHWADPDTLEILPELAHEVPIVASIRTDDPDGGPALAILASLGTRFEIEPLCGESARALARHTAPAASDAEVCDLVDQAGGNPLLLTCAPAGNRADDRLVALVARASTEGRYALARMALTGHPSWSEQCDVIRELDGLGLVVRAEDEGWTVRHDSFGQAAVSLLSCERAIRHPSRSRRDERHSRRTRPALHARRPAGVRPRPCPRSR